jgi:hypothetical protein
MKIIKDKIVFEIDKPRSGRCKVFVSAIKFEGESNYTKIITSAIARRKTVNSCTAWINRFMRFTVSDQETMIRNHLIKMLNLAVNIVTRVQYFRLVRIVGNGKYEKEILIASSPYYSKLFSLAKHYKGIGKVLIYPSTTRNYIFSKEELKQFHIDGGETLATIPNKSRLGVGSNKPDPVSKYPQKTKQARNTTVAFWANK